MSYIFPGIECSVINRLIAAGDVVVEFVYPQTSVFPAADLVFPARPKVQLRPPTPEERQSLTRLVVREAEDGE